MNTQTNAIPESFDSQRIAPNVSPTLPMYWSIRRELCENRSIYVAPLATAAVYLFGYLISLLWVPYSMRAMAALHSAPPLIVLAMPYSYAGMLTTVIAFIVGIFYSLDALYGERRDRTILFWKSLPVSDGTTVLSKLSVVVILQLLSFAIVVVTQLTMALISSLVLAASGLSVATLWVQL